MSTEFTIRSIELRDYNRKHNCRVLKVIGNNKLLVELSPPIPGCVYGQSDDITYLVLAPRYEGTTLVPDISEWPYYVNMCLPEKPNDCESESYEILDIGLLEIAKT